MPELGAGKRVEAGALAQNRKTLAQKGLDLHLMLGDGTCLGFALILF